MSINDPILWLDLETTGLDPNEGHILEVGLLVTDGFKAEVAELSLQIKPSAFNPFLLPPEVYAMHSESGLFDAIYANGVSHQGAVNRVQSFLDEHFGQSYDITVGGSGIDRFDLVWLKAIPAWVGVANRFHFRTFDVSATKALMKRAGLDVAAPSTAHRAAEDARWAFHVAQQAHSYFDAAREAL